MEKEPVNIKRTSADREEQRRVTNEFFWQMADAEKALRDKKTDALRNLRKSLRTLDQEDQP